MLVCFDILTTLEIISFCFALIGDDICQYAKEFLSFNNKKAILDSSRTKLHIRRFITTDED